MPFPPRDRLKTDRLYLTVIGPGTGETVLVRVPPDQWLIVDSFHCGRPSRAAGISVVEHFGGSVAVLALTHPHADHYPGMLGLIDANASAILGCVHPRDSGPVGGPTNDATAALKQGAKPTYTRIWDEWTKTPARRWNTFRGESISVGAATVTSLHPLRPIAPTAWSAEPNAISSAMLVRWKDTQVLLGADIPNTEWPGIAGTFVGLGNHVAMKVPHHGSREAIDNAFGIGSKSRIWVVTPFRRQRLPRAADTANDGSPEGLASILTFVSEVSLSALPFRHRQETNAPCRTSRPQVRDNIRPVRDDGIDENLMISNAALDRFVIVEIDAAGEISDVIYGPGSVAIVP